MLYLEQTSNRVIFMTASSIANAILLASIQGINAVGVLFAAAVINILIYYALSDSYSKAYTRNRPNRIN